MKWKGKVNFDSRPEYNSNPLLSEDSNEFGGFTEKTIAHDNDWLLLEDSESSYIKKKIKYGNVGGGEAPLFGSQFHQVSSDGESTTTSTTFQNKLTLTTSSLLSGTYRLGYAFELSNGSNGILSHVQIVLDSSTVGYTTYEADNDYHSLGGFVYATLSGVEVATIDHKTDTGGTSKIRRARLELWRIS